MSDAQRIAQLEREIAGLRFQMRRPVNCAAIDAELREHQARADRVAQAFGDQADPPMPGESALRYRRRLVAKFQDHSPTWRGVDLSLAGEAEIAVAEKQVFADALAEATAPSNVPAGRLVERTEIDDAGRKIRRFYGDIEACFGPFKRPGRRITGFAVPK